MRAPGIQEIEVYINRHHKTVAQYIATCPIMDLSLDMERRMRFWTLTIWW